MRKFQKPRDTRASAVRLLRSNENRVARQIQNTQPLTILSRVIGKNIGGLVREERGRKGEKNEGCEHEAETQRGERQTADSRGLRKGRNGMEVGRASSAIKRGGIQEAHEGGKGSRTLPHAHAEGREEGKRSEERRRRVGARRGERRNTGFKEDNDLCLR
jgi:hypothetical protein